MAFHGKALSFMEQIKTGSKKLHTESNLCSNSPSFRKFQTGIKLTMVSQYRAQCAAPRTSIRYGNAFLLSHASTYPQVPFQSILQMLLNSQPSSMHTRGIPRIALCQQVNQRKAKSCDSSVRLFCPISHTTPIYIHPRGTNSPEAVQLFLLGARVSREPPLCPT